MSGSSPALADGQQPAARLRALLEEAEAAGRCELVPACHDAMSAALIQRAGFRIAFMSGYAVSASQLALPDAGLISYGEQLQVGRNICAACPELCVIGDGDTGFGSSGNIKRTIEGFAAAGFAGISIEDQVYPKRCSFAKGLAVVSRDEAYGRVLCAIDARDKNKARTGRDLVIIARTDCRNATGANGGFEEAIARCLAFRMMGADIVYAEGLANYAEMTSFNERLRDEVVGIEGLASRTIYTHTMLAQVERPGYTMVSPEKAAEAGFTLSLLGLEVLNASISAMKETLARLANPMPSISQGAKKPRHAKVPRLSFEELYKECGFDDHYTWEELHHGEGHRWAASMDDVKGLRDSMKNSSTSSAPPQD